MIFHPDLAKAIEGGGKTEMRRRGFVDREVGRLRPPAFHVGETYPVMAKGEAVARCNILINEIREERLGDITPAGVKAEGHATVAGFARAWMRIYDSSWPPTEEQLCSKCGGHACDRCDLGVVDVEVDLEDKLVLEIFEARHADRHVWVVAFELDRRLMLHRNVHRGYTHDPKMAAKGEPEVIDPAALEAYTEQARRTYEVTHHGELAQRRAKTLSRRLLQAAAKAPSAGVLDEIERRIAELEQAS